RSVTRSAATSRSSTPYAIRTDSRISWSSAREPKAAGRSRTRRGCWPNAATARTPRWLNGEVPPKESFRTLMKLGKAYNPHSGMGLLARVALEGAWRSKLRPEALIFAAHYLLPGWSVIDRLGEINVPTLVIAGKDDFIFPPGHQAGLGAR